MATRTPHVYYIYNVYHSAPAVDAGLYLAYRAATLRGWEFVE